MQGTIRAFPDAFLARSVIVCEGASEVGLFRGLDLHRISVGKESLAAQGAALVDCGGGDSDRPFKRASALHSLGYRVAVVRDDDKSPTKSVEEAFIVSGGYVAKWQPGHALEDELFMSLSYSAVLDLLNYAVNLLGEPLVNDHLKSASSNAVDISVVHQRLRAGALDDELRKVLGRAAKGKSSAWFKTISRMEDIARDIVGPDLPNATEDFRGQIEKLFEWVENGGG